jgi:hypothetical protein
MIIIFNGPPAAGKDEATAQFVERGYKHLSFKEVLIEETCKYFGVTREWFMNGYNIRRIKEEPKSALLGKSRRSALIHVSENVIKPKYGKDFFGQRVAEKIEPDVDYAISDGGFSEEIAPILKNVNADEIILVQLMRDGCSYHGDSRRYFNGDVYKEYVIGHSTTLNEADLLPERLPLYTFRIHNNGSLVQFHKTLREIYNFVQVKRAA